MRTINTLRTLLLVTLGLTSCNREGPDNTSEPNQAEAPTPSKELATDFPLLPLIEKSLWSELLHHEAIVNNPGASHEELQPAREKIDQISTRLKELHPFDRSDDRITLGAVSYQQKTGHIELMARVNDLAAQRKEELDDIEVILCTEKGRIHESLFVTTARPLHLEILMHLAGYTNTPTPPRNEISQFHILISLPNHPPIPVGDLLVSKTGSPLPNPLLWEFSGSSFDNLYRPDLTGDLIIVWHAHDAVVQSSDPKLASNELRLLPKPHPSLKAGMAVKVTLVPIQER